MLNKIKKLLGLHCHRWTKWSLLFEAFDRRFGYYHVWQVKSCKDCLKSKIRKIKR